jgi:hypothetical protein
MTANGDRRFHEGELIDLPPMQYRLVHGTKGPEDLRLDWRYVTEWRPVELEHAALIVDAIADNENILYPPPAAGGGKVWAFMRCAFRDGWTVARWRLHEERANKADRLFNDGALRHG